jgi:hypothetical protein
VPSAEHWINSEIKVMWNKQQQSGIIEGWHGDGNFARTTIMYCLWKTQGSYLIPWRKDLELGAVQMDSTLYLTVASKEEWNGRIFFDRKRHADFMHLPVDWPRINQFPEYFTIENSKFYSIRFADGKVESDTLNGAELLKGFPLIVKPGNTVKLSVKAINQ